jgi:hypothetical protein
MIKNHFSYGIACYSNNELLFVSKRISWNFSQFAHGRYCPNSDKELNSLFSGMTKAEKMIIMAGDFKMVQLYADLSLSKSEISENKFKQLFSNKKRIRNLLEQSKCIYDLEWMLPSGHKKNITETDIDCAQREFTEETEIPRTHYHLFPEYKKTICRIFPDAPNDRYYMTYYLAIAYDRKLSLRMENYEQYVEIRNVKWMNLLSLNGMQGLDMYRFFIKIGRKLNRYYYFRSAPILIR